LRGGVPHNPPQRARGVSFVYVPLVDDFGIDAVVRKQNNQFIEVQIKARSSSVVPGDAALFAAIVHPEVRENYYFVFYSERLDAMWIMSSSEFIAEAVQNKTGKNAGKRSIWFNGRRTDKQTGALIEYPNPRFDKYRAQDFSRFREVTHLVVLPKPEARSTRLTRLTNKIDTLVMIIADQNGGKSNQMRSLFEEFELHHCYNGYPRQANIARKYYVHPDMDLFMRLASWHEKNQDYAVVKRELRNGYLDIRRRYKVFVPAQVTPTSKLIGGEDLFMQLFTDFDIRRGFAVWLDPDRSSRRLFGLSARFAAFMSTRRHVSSLAIDSLAAHPSPSPATHSVNARLLADFLFRI
jgi:hypothetical protein